MRWQRDNATRAADPLCYWCANCETIFSEPLTMAHHLVDCFEDGNLLPTLDVPPESDLLVTAMVREALGMPGLERDN